MKSELDKLEEFLKENGYEYERNDEPIIIPFEEEDHSRHQIIVYRYGERWWDVVCQYGSYGYEEELLEGYGGIFRDAEGYLTAKDVIKRLETNLEKITKRKEEIMEFLNSKTKEELVEYAYKQQIIIDQLRGEEDGRSI